MSVKQLQEKVKVAYKYASTCQDEADKMAFNMLNQREVFGAISVAQSICDFNLSWLYSVSPEIVLHTDSIVFICENIKEFKRKITIKEIIQFDGIIHHRKPKDFDDFKKIIT